MTAQILHIHLNLTGFFQFLLCRALRRVIRTAEDIGIVALLDDRFLTETYLRMFPREWKTFERVSLQRIEKKISDFWEEKG